MTEDKQSITDIANNLDAFISDIALPTFRTIEAQNLAVVFISKFKSVIHEFEQAANKL